MHQKIPLQITGPIKFDPFRVCHPLGPNSNPLKAPPFLKPTFQPSWLKDSPYKRSGPLSASRFPPKVENNLFPPAFPAIKRWYSENSKRKITSPPPLKEGGRTRHYKSAHIIMKIYAIINVFEMIAISGKQRNDEEHFLCNGMWKRTRGNWQGWGSLMRGLFFLISPRLPRSAKKIIRKRVSWQHVLPPSECFFTTLASGVP